ncbi:MerR family transcriptional regulator [Sphaerisporangium corydalis]|uniref:MerR family transcriptional regulator n=1 Tax=Sphaerisporangium corydalis TaxID=1441875 RepID=A0ABV9EKH4_9ACTN|nr:MerR family transcriptional regulator [Sphaerisporangium corydalis]
MDERTGGPAEVPVGEGPSYGIGAVARRLGVPAPTLRTWNLRYGIGPSHRSPGGHRRYDAADLLRLQEMNRLIKAGLPPAEAAQQALRPSSGPGGAPGPALHDGVGAVGTDDRPAAGPEDAGGEPGNGPRPDSDLVPRPERPAGVAVRGARAVRIPSVAVLARAALNLDGNAVVSGLVSALDGHGVTWTWERLVLPVFEVITRRQDSTGAGVELEHLFSERVLSVLSERTGRPARPAHPRPVLLACAEDDQHSLPLYALAATLTTAYGLDTRILGPRTPYSALADAMRRLGPLAVFVWSQLEITGDPEPLRGLPVLRPASRIVVGGPGWWSGHLPPGVGRAFSLDDAVAQVRAAIL